MKEQVLVFNPKRDNSLTNIDRFFKKIGIDDFEVMKELCVKSFEKVSGLKVSVYFTSDCMEYWTTDTSNPEDEDVKFITFIELEICILSAQYLADIERLNKTLTSHKIIQVR